MKPDYAEDEKMRRMPEEHDDAQALLCLASLYYLAPTTTPEQIAEAQQRAKEWKPTE